MRRVFGRFVLSLPLLICALGMLGCAESFTTSRRSNEEGMRLYSQNMYGDAAGAFRDAVKQEPRLYQAHFYLGVCYDQLREHQQAFREYRTTLEIMDADVQGHWDDAFRQIVLDTYAAAVARYDEHEVELAELERRAATNPGVNNLFLLAKACRLRGDADAALAAYRKAAVADKWDFNVRKELGLYLLDPLQLREEAAYYLQQAHRLDPNDLAVNTGLAQLNINPPPAYQAADPAIQPPALRPAPVVKPASATGNSTAHLPRD
jgi:Flp pilus assembly protein TadD